MNNLDFINELKLADLIPSAKIKKALLKADRLFFVLPEYQKYCYQNLPLQIGFGQTISQPTVVIGMLHLLDVKNGQKILDVGAGSGWTTALLANLVGKKGKVFGVEIIPELVKMGRSNLDKIKIKNACIKQAGKKLGLEDEAPFDRILVSATSKLIPENLVKQLKDGGIMIIPIKNSILKIVKKGDEYIIAEEIFGFSFVPLIS